MAVFAMSFLRILRSYANASFDIFGQRNNFKVIDVYASSIAAQVVYLHSFRNRPIHLFPSRTVSEFIDPLPSAVDATISLGN